MELFGQLNKETKYFLKRQNQGFGGPKGAGCPKSIIHHAKGDES